MKNVILPVAIELVVDDVGWHNGADERYLNLPARSGLPRFHHPDDVKALNAIGEALNMKIICSFMKMTSSIPRGSIIPQSATKRATL